MAPTFDYDGAFARNIGWLTRREQMVLRAKRIAIAGLGGVGGSHLLTLVRLGVGAFNIADLDTFDLVNFNRQAGAFVSTLGQPKVDILMRMARDINPEIDIRLFPQGVTPANIGDFLEGVDLYVDGLDFFVFSVRAMTFAKCREHRIPAVTAAPLGMGSAVLSFMPDGMSFEDYFGFEGRSEDELALRFMIGLSPLMLHRNYLADPSAVDLDGRRGPSTIMACELCAGLAATESLKILLGRGKLLAAPHGFHFDAYRNKLVRTWRPWGHRNPIQRVMLAIARRQLAAMRQASRHA
ncbi:MAG: ThiF family adenylyltransferase [Rhodocyclaceae bacterium]|nr:ThiF family adenylyltransferase [Rhodocyclaceae bacterium]